MAEHSMRIAGDGELYTLSEFQAYYLEAAEDMWQRATHVTATERDVPPTLLLQSIPAPCVSDDAQLAAANPANIPEHIDVNATERDLPPPSTHVVNMHAANSITQPAATEHNFPELRFSRVVSLLGEIRLQKHHWEIRLQKQDGDVNKFKLVDKGEQYRSWTTPEIPARIVQTEWL